SCKAIGSPNGNGCVMANFLAAQLLSFGVIGSATGQSVMRGPSSLSPPVAEALFNLHLDAWHAACELKRIQCPMYPMPKVAYGFLAGALGSYTFKSNTVLLDIRLIGQPISKVILVHEMIHYIQDKQRGSQPEVTIAVACHDEEEAFRLSYTYSIINNVALDDPRNKDWPSAMWAYPGCVVMGP